jgi:glycine cleavage system H protein
MPNYIEVTVDKFIFRVASDRLYSPDGMWALTEGNNVRIGITDYLQQLNGDAAFIHVKPAGSKLAAGDELAELETIKANVSLYSPVSGTIVEVNSDLDLSPEVINQEPYDKGWLSVIEAIDWNSDKVKLLEPQAYLSLMRSQAEEETKQK